MRALLLAMVVTVGCSHHNSVPPDDVDAPPGDFELACESHATTFPLLDRSCSVATDCVIANHMIDCCGTFNAIGINIVSESAFAAAENTCEAGFPGCGCASRPTMAEDGRTRADGPIALRCENQVCRTYVP
jgi:hypothetical protein